MKIQTPLFALWLLAAIACNAPVAESPATLPASTQPAVVGTWQLVAATHTQADSSFSTFDPTHKMIKILNGTHFAFLNHDLKGGKDTTAAAFVAGGGTYTLKGNDYTEFLEYCNYREWENKSFDFKLEVKNDTLIQRGVEKVEELGVDRTIVETYVRVP